MNHTAFVALPSDVQELVIQIEDAIGREISIRHETKRGNLGALVERHEVIILAPCNAVIHPASLYHELLHAKRLLVEGVPRLSIDPEVDDDRTESIVRMVDNNIEHLCIVPIEIGRFPERASYWLGRIATQIVEQSKTRSVDEDSLYLSSYACLFARYVLSSTSLEKAAIKAIAHAEEVAIRIPEVFEVFEESRSSKKQLVRALFNYWGFTHQRFFLQYLVPEDQDREYEPLVG
jgi:hypothetical protein